MKQMPYESQYIGNFLYVLGLKRGVAKGIAASGDAVAVNSVQQTPADPLFGDLIWQGMRRGLLIEFKRSWEEIWEERSKQTKHGLHTALLNPNFDGRTGKPDPELDNQLAGPSMDCHYIAYGSPAQRNQPPTILFEQYLPWLRRTGPRRLVRPPTSPIIPFGPFVEQVADEQRGASVDRFRWYLHELAKFGSRTRDSQDIAGLVILLRGDGQIGLMQVADLRRIRLGPAPVLAPTSGPGVQSPPGTVPN